MKLVYFAWIRERIGKEEETITLPDSVTKVRDLLVWQRQRGEEYEAAFEDLETVRVALDQFHAEPDDEIGQAEEIAFFPAHDRRLILTGNIETKNEKSLI